MKAKERFICRYCKSTLKTVLDLGDLYPSGFVEKGTRLEKEPVVLGKCISCNLVQLKFDYDLDLMYRQYWYASSLNKSMVNSLKEVVDSAKEIKPNIKVAVDIGCNDGTLLEMFGKDVVTVGFDPALNLKNVAKKNCTHFINDYFSAENYPLDTKADIVTSIAMFYDLPDPRRFIQDVKSILSEDGVWIIQLTDLYSMLKINAIDNICMEHLEYYTLDNLLRMMHQNGMSIFKVEYNKVNGGSIRVFVSHFGSRKIEEHVLNAYYEEFDYIGEVEEALKGLMYRFNVEKDYLKDVLKSIRKANQTCLVYGASTKGNTLLQLCGIDNNLIKYAAEVNKDKFGLVTAGTNIEIISQEDAMKMKPDYFLCLPWHFKESILENSKKYLDNGGIFIFPLPKVKLIGKDQNGNRK